MKYISRVFFVLFALMLFTACTQVDTGHRGVQVRFGEVDMKLGSLPEGLYTYNPFTTSIIELDTRVQRWEGKTNTYTKDVQQADITFVVNYRLDGNGAHAVYKEVGYNWANVLLPQAVEGILKQVVGKYDAVDLIEYRGRATAEVQKAIADSLLTKNIIVDRFELVNIAYLKEFEKAVEDKVIATQKAVEEKNRTVQVQEKAKQTIIAAQSEAESMRIRANALANNPKLVEYEAVQRWDGKLPQYTLGGATPFINIR